MNILAIETSLSQCSVALLHNGKISSIEAEQPSQQSSQLFPLINKLLEQNSLRLADINVIACTVGPGSFTGVRIGIAAARAINKVISSMKLLGVSTLELLAYAAIVSSRRKLGSSTLEQHDIAKSYTNLDPGFRRDDTQADYRVVALIESGRGEFYMQKFNNTVQPLKEIILITEEQLHQQLQSNEIIVSNKELINASLVLGRALELLEEGVVHNAIYPLYIKAPSITKQKL